MSYRLFAILGLAIAAAGIPAHSASAEPHATAAVAADRSPFIGAWELDLARMPANYGPSPKRVLFTFEDLGADTWRTTIAITAPDGSVRRSSIRHRRDGTAVPGEGDTREADSAAFASPAGNVLVMGLAKDKHLGSVRTYTIAPDGQEMTESAAGTDGDGTPFVRTFHFRRIR